MEFIKTNNGYIAEYSATTHFNLHIEGGGRVMLYKRTSGSQGDLIASIPSNVVDVDVSVNFPAIYTIVVTERPSLVTITTAEGSEEVEIPAAPEPDTPSDIPSGYETFECAEGAFEVADGYLYVKL